MLVAEKFLENWTTILTILFVLFLVVKFIFPFLGIGGNQRKYKKQLEKEQAEIVKRREMRERGEQPSDHDHDHDHGDHAHDHEHSHSHDEHGAHTHAHNHDHDGDGHKKKKDADKKSNWKGFLIGIIIAFVMVLLASILIAKCCIENNKKRTHRKFVKIEKEAHKNVPLFYCLNFIIEYQEAGQLQAYSG